LNIEQLIIKNLIHNEDYARAALPFIEKEYFSGPNEKIIFSYIQNFINVYNQRPTSEAIKIIASESAKQVETEKEINELLDGLGEYQTPDLTWLTNETEKFCQEKALHNALLESINIFNNPNDKREKGIIPELLKQALAKSFDPSIGHDFIEEAEGRYDFYHRKEERIPFDISNFNLITNGGIPKKTLTIICAGVNVGKSLAMCHFATSYLLQGKNVLYITMEMAEEKIAERIDANILDISLDSLAAISKTQYLKMIDKMRKSVTGKLVIKEYPTASANVNHFRKLLSELALKKKFTPDIIVLDYLNICSSSRIKNNGLANTYVLVKSIAEELRGLAVEYDLPIITATQINRSSYSNTDPDMTSIAESFGVAATCDLAFSIINTEELERLGQYQIKQLKNRLSDVTKNKRFNVGVDRSKMRLIDLGDQSADDLEEMENDRGIADDTKFNKFSSFKF